jgi:hypothetical protein
MCLCWGEQAAGAVRVVPWRYPLSSVHVGTAVPAPLIICCLLLCRLLNLPAAAFRCLPAALPCSITPLMTAYFCLAAANVIPELRKHFAELR